MCCIAMIAQDVTMATTELMHAASCVVCWPREGETRQEFRAPRMNWVVVTDENHNRRMKMVWTP